MDLQGIIFELQWKKKQGVANREEDIANLGIWDTADSASSLNWMTFQSYLCQNLGTREAISVAYVDSEGDELPIESECEFQEALKFARQRARRSRKIVLKVDKKDASNPSSKVDCVDKPRFVKLSKNVPKLAVDHNKMNSIDYQFKSFKQAVTSELKELQKSNKLLTEKLESMTKQEDQKKSEVEDEAPDWFKIYMQKMKRQIVEEVNASTWQLMSSMSVYRPLPAVKPETLAASPMKKRSSDEDSSDAALGSDQRDHKLLRKIEKLHKREKKLEKKLDSKLEKLENKTKRMMEKKSQSKVRPEWDRIRPEWDRIPEKKSSRKKFNDGHVGPNPMDAVLLNDGPKYETRIKLGKRFTKIWEIMNNGSLPWTDKTELRLAWGTLGLEPEEPVVKCPLLEPGEKGQIAVNFRAPDFPGMFEVYWHFYHMGQRFGHCIGCAVAVDEALNIGDDEECATSSKKRFKEALSKPAAEKEEERGNFEKLDNVEALKSESAAGGVQRSENPSTSQNLNNIQIESNIQHAEVAIDLSNKPKCDGTAVVNNNNNVNASPGPVLVTAPAKVPTRDPEYWSDSDDDNLSIISAGGEGEGGNLSSSDSGFEQFVMVPMPVCFQRDVPLDSVHKPLDSVNVPPDSVNVPLDSIKAYFGSADASLGSANASLLGSAQASLGSAQALLGSAHASLGSANESLGSANVSLASANASVGSAHKPLATEPVKDNCASAAPAVAPAAAPAAAPAVAPEAEDDGDSSSTASHDGGERWWDSEDFRSNVYAVDAAGTCVPLETAWPINEATKIRLGCAARGCGTPSPKRGPPREQAPRGDTYHTATFRTGFQASARANGGPVFAYAHNAFGGDESVAPGFRPRNPQTYEFGSTLPPPNCFNGAYDAVPTPPQAGKSGADQPPPQAQKSAAAPAATPKASGKGHATSHSHSKSHSASGKGHTSSHSHSKSHSASFSSSSSSSSCHDGSVHILPETIVNGAINVANSAYSTARALISNLGAIPSAGCERRGRGGGEPTTAECLLLLGDMGFLNRNLNVLLLQRYDNDVAKVVAELLRGSTQQQQPEQPAAAR